jgi:glutathione S-transferase
VLPESRAIMEYLEERFPEPALLPGDARRRALVRVALDRFERLSSAYYGWRNRNEPALRLDDQLRKLDEALVDGYLVDGRLTLADIGYVPWLLRAEQLGVPVRQFGRIAAWLEELGTRPAIAAEIEVVNALPTPEATGDLSLWKVSA